MINLAKRTKLIIIGLFSIFFITTLIIVVAVNTLSKRTNQPPLYFPQILKNSLTNNQLRGETSQNFIILGLDPRNDLLEKTVTTDTIIFTKLDLANSPTLRLVSLPRDLWNYQQGKKINDIYPQSLATGDPNLILSQFSQITGQSISHYLVITTQDLIDFIALIGGVDVNLENGFIDDQYPNPDHISNPGSTAPVYITIEFKKGLNHLDESNVTQFVRSRKSSDNPLLGGTDLGRITRQQLLINAIISKVMQPQYTHNIGFIFQLYHFWQNHFQTNITDQYLSDLIINHQRQLLNLNLQKYEIPIATSASTEGVIYHPQFFENNQWVFIPKSKDYRELIDFIKNLSN